VPAAPSARFAHLAFDLDGTLVDTSADIAAALNVALTAVGREPLPVGDVVLHVGEGARRLVEQALGAADVALVDRATTLFLDHYARHVLDVSRPYPGIVEALAALAEAGSVCTVLSNKPEALTRAIVSGLGLSRFVAAVIGGDSLPVRKPDPRGLWELCTLVGVVPAATLVVGDSLIDAATARAAGAAFCGVAWGFGRDALEQAAIAPLLQRPGDLVTFVAGERPADGAQAGRAGSGAARSEA